MGIKATLWFSLLVLGCGAMPPARHSWAVQGMQENTLPLTPGVPQTGSIPAASEFRKCLLAETQYTIPFPGGAARLTIELRGDRDVDLYVRRNQRVGREGDQVVADFRLETSRDSETLHFPLVGTLPLEAGTYFIAVSNCDPSGAATFMLTATLFAALAEETVTLPRERAEVGAIAAPPPGRCALGQTQYMLSAFAGGPCGGIADTILLRGDQNVDLYIRFGQRVVEEEGRIVADFVLQSPSNFESFTFLSPARSGTYFIAVSNCSSQTANFTIGVSQVIADGFGPILTFCRLERSPTGVFSLRIFGSNIRQGAMVTIGGVAPKKVKFKSPEPGGTSFSEVVAKGRVCRALPGTIIVANPAQGTFCPGVPLNCTERCPD